MQAHKLANYNMSASTQRLKLENKSDSVTSIKFAKVS